eukprot:COSAG01_NODE_5367_length_4305_cov_60.283642_8_plen_50_part_00
MDTVENSRSVEKSEDMHRTALSVLREEKVGFVHFKSLNIQPKGGDVEGF